MKYIVLLLFLSSSGAGQTVSDTTSTDSLPIYYLGEMFVVAKRVARWVIPPSELDLHEIQKENAKTVADAINLLPGVDITVGFKNEASLTIQGFTSKRIAVLVDGRPVNNPYYGNTDLLSITTDNISRIDVIQGSNAPILAANAMGGIVNIVTEAPKDAPYTKLFMDYGSGNTYDVKLNHGVPIRLPNLAQFYYAVNFYRGASDGFPLPDKFQPSGFDDGGLRDNSDYSRTNFQLKLGYRDGDRLHIGISGGLYRSTKAVPPAEKLDASFWRFPYWNRDYVDLSGEFRPSINLAIRSKFYADRFVNDLISYKTREFDENDIWWNSLHDLRDWGTLWEINHILSDVVHIGYGVQYRYDIMNRRPDINEPWLRNTLQTGNISASVSAVWDKLNVLASLHTPIFRSDSSTSWDYLIDPSIGLSYALRNGITLWGSVARSSRFPTGHELYSTKSGNPHLKPEKAIRLQSGLKLSIADNLLLSLSGYYNDIHDMIDRPSRDSIYRNIFHARTAGSEFSINYKRGDYFVLTLSYTNIIGEDIETGAILPGIANHKVTGALEYRPSDMQLIRLSVYYRSKRFWPGKTLAPCLVVNTYTEQVIWGPLKGFISIKNLFDTLYEEEPYYPMPGRTVTLGFMLDM